MGRNEWKEGASWPIKGARPTRLYLHSKGHANGLQGDGYWMGLCRLREMRSSTGSTMTLTTQSKSHQRQRTGRQRSGERRDDALNYDSGATEKGYRGHRTGVRRAVRVIICRGHRLRRKARGRISERLRAPCRRRYNHVQIQRISRGADQHQAGEVYKLTLDLWNTSNFFQKDHKIRVEVTSSDFPRYARNMNSGRPFGDDLVAKIAHQKIFHDAEHPSARSSPSSAGLTFRSDGAISQQAGLLQ